MGSLKLIVTLCFAFAFYERVLSLNTTPGLENSNEHIQHAGGTSTQPEKTGNPFSNETFVHINSFTLVSVSDKVPVSSGINDSIPTNVSQNLNKTTTEGLASVTPTILTADSVASVHDIISSKVNTNSASDYQSSTERITHNVEVPLEGGGTVANTHPNMSGQIASKGNITTMQNNESISLENIYSDTEQSNTASTVVAGKGAEYKSSKIVPRKGVGSCSCCPNVTYSENCTICCSSPNELNSREEIDEDKMNVQDIAKATATNLDNNTTIEQRTNSSAVTSHIETKKTKATKPLYTVDVVNENVGNISAIQTPTKKLQQGSNYVVPVVGTILMVPLVAVLSVFLYKKGCEFWERRHYRRMDFLIDGMYND